MELTQLYLHEAADLLQRGEITSENLTRAHLARISVVDRQLNSFLTVTGEQALQSALQADRERHAGIERGSLHGIPLALKDLYDTRAIRTTAGAQFFANRVPERDATVVEKLASAGMVLLGKLNMHEIALGLTNVNPHYGACRNPWAPERISGGSSGGSAVALAAELCLGSMGSDTGGSIRIPAALCGVVGLKPTYGRVSLRGVFPLSWNLDHAGPMARCVKDAAILLQTVAGYDPDDPACIPAPLDDWLAGLEAGIKGWRIALAVGEYFEDIDPAVRQAVEQAAQVFTHLGAQVEPVQFPLARQAAQLNGLMVVSDAAALHHQRLQEHPETFGADIRQRLQTGAATTVTDYILARRNQTELRHAFEAFFEGYDLLLTATSALTAPPIEGPDAIEQARRLTRFTAPFNLTGLPALSLPCGFDQQSLPIGLQIVARPWAEAAILRAAYAYEQAAGWFRRRPELNS